MKNGIMVAFLAASLLVNVALGIKALSSGQTAECAPNHNTAVTPTVPAAPYSLEQFASLVDGQRQVLPFVAPTKAMNSTLVVYLHSMGSSYSEPFDHPRGSQTVAEAISDKSIGLISCPCRGKEGWAQDLVISDITQNIRFALQSFPFKGIVLMGTSMGACTALSYATLAPEDIKSKLIGIVSVEGAGDLVKLHKLAGHPDVQRSMEIAFGGTPDQIPAEYKKKSVLHNLSKLPSNVRILVISAKQDSLVPPVLQRDIIEALEKEKRPCKLIEVEGDHRFPAASLYKQALDWVM